jgi:ribosomal protein S18 acetylase RimI-like enzyme
MAVFRGILPSREGAFFFFRRFTFPLRSQVRSLALLSIAEWLIVSPPTTFALQGSWRYDLPEMNSASSEHILIRIAIESDIAAILPLWRELMEFHSDFDSRFRLAADAVSPGKSHLRLELTKPTSFLGVAEHHTGIVGYCLASVHRQPSFFEHRAYGFVSEFHVSDSFRRRGVGRSLFATMKQWFQRKDVSRIELVTMNANPHSIAFWQSMGCCSYAERRFIELDET